MRERSGRQDVPERSVPSGLARRASAANATTESGGEAEIAGGVGMWCGAARRSLRSARGAAHSVDAATGLVGKCWTKVGYLIIQASSFYSHGWRQSNNAELGHDRRENSARG